MIKHLFHNLKGRLTTSLLILLLTGCGTLLQPQLTQHISDVTAGNYRLDNKHTALLFKVNHLGFSTFIGRFEEVSATLDYNPKQPEQSSLTASVNMASVNVNNRAFETTLKNRFWFNTQKFPMAHYRTTSAQQTAANRLLFHGELTFLGVTKPLSFDVTINGAGYNRVNGNYTLGISAAGAVIRSEHGLGLFEPAIGNTVTLEIHAEFIRR